MQDAVADNMRTLFLVLLLADLVVHLRVRRLRSLSKCLLMPLLLACYVLEAKPADPLALAALLAATAGDILLIRPEKPVRFLTGLTAFLLGHVLWIAVFLASTGWMKVVPSWFALASVPYLGAAILFLSRLWKDLAGKRAVFLLYCAGIVLMSGMALARAFTHAGPAFWLPFVGSLLFLASDAMLAFHLFHARIRWGDPLIMGSYVGAQTLIVLGLLA